MRAVNLLTPSQRASFANPPTQQADLIRYYTLESAALRFINRHRGAANRLGVAVQLCYHRFPGRPLAYRETVPARVLSFIAAQLTDVEPIDHARYAVSRQFTHYDHAQAVRRFLGCQPFTTKTYRLISMWLVPLAIENDEPVLLVRTVLEELSKRGYLTPRLELIERLCFEARKRAERRVCRALTKDLDASQRAALDSLLRTKDESTLSYLSWLRNPPHAATAPSLLRVIDRVVFVRELDIASDRGSSVPRDRLRHLAKEGHRYSAQHLSRLEQSRRHGTLIATMIELSLSLTDDAIRLFDRLLGRTFRKAQRRHTDAFQKDGRVINEKVRHYAQTGRAVIDAREDGNDPFAAIEGVMSWERFIASVEEAESLAQPEAFDYLAYIDPQYSTMRRYSPRFLETFEFKGAPSAQPLLAALDALRTMNRSKRRVLPPDVPTSFVNRRWRDYIFGDGGQVNKRYYEFCVLAELRDRLRAGEVWVVGGREYQDLEDHLIDRQRFASIVASNSVPLAVGTDASTYLDTRRKELDERLSSVAAKAKDGLLPGVTLENGELRFAPIESNAPRTAERLSDRLYAMVPQVRITELLEEVDNWTRFTDGFTHLRRGTAASDKRTLMTTILADATNLGLSRIVDVP